mmetsp:Transcript_41573/g.133675  ORF Transcript_41573/g.133675 Transcript_41573/m.133675 type:complete len:236 (-) Transcript_41573:123-830(-)
MRRAAEAESASKSGPCRRPSVANAQSRLVASCALKASGVAAAKVASSSSNAGCGASTVSEDAPAAAACRLAIAHATLATPYASSAPDASSARARAAIASSNGDSVAADPPPPLPAPPLSRPTAHAMLVSERALTSSLDASTAAVRSRRRAAASAASAASAEDGSPPAALAAAAHERFQCASLPPSRALAGAALASRCSAVAQLTELNSAHRERTRERMAEASPRASSALSCRAAA